MNYKKAVASIALVPLMGTTFAAEEMMENTMIETTSMMESNMSMEHDVSTMMGLHIVAANYLAEQNVIEDNSGSVEEYNFTSNITRREMVKVAMNISGMNVPETCNGEFSDLNWDDWGCKYAEAALAQGYIAANASFRPDDLITNSESLKMIMQAKNIARDENDDWRAGYASKAMSEGIVNAEYEFDVNAKRGWIFDISALAYPEFKAMIDAQVSVGVEVGGARALTDILTYHVVAGSYTSADITDGLMLTTVQGQDLMFTIENGVVMINGSAMVETADVISSNGVTHVIDSVLMPETGVEVGGAMMLPSMDIVENAMNADNVTTLVAAVSSYWYTYISRSCRIIYER